MYGSFIHEIKSHVTQEPLECIVTFALIRFEYRTVEVSDIFMLVSDSVRNPRITDDPCPADIRLAVERGKILLNIATRYNRLRRDLGAVRFRISVK